jgi:RNA 2',3'-cyclic 3'-phosphodiesterase
VSGDGSARLFVALELPGAVAEALVAWRDPLLRDAGEALRPVAPDALHVTLCFLGSRPQAAVEPLTALVEGCAGPVAGLALGEPLWLPRRRPRVLAIALDDRHGELTSLQGRVVERLVADGWHEPEARPYLPHVTVARVRGEAHPPHGTVPAVPPDVLFDGAALTLFRSRLHPSGARYEALSRHALA